MFASCFSQRPAAQPQPAEPPVTRHSLSELDVSKIIHNPKLRHDINFDPELHFRPNMDGEKGRKKSEKASIFWRALRKELGEFLVDKPSFYRKYGQNGDWTLPALLRSVKDIMQTLVPQRDRQFLDEGLNIELLMQQFHKGVADLEKMAQWLSEVLKSHCAPMRDSAVDSMYTDLSMGNRDSDLDLLVSGLRQLLAVLESMKLDVANHQIRCLRIVLIEDTTPFGLKFFYKKMQSRKVDAIPTKQWYVEAEQAYSHALSPYSQLFGETAIFFEALSRTILPSGAHRRLPTTFMFDEERIAKLKSDMLDAVNLEVCMRMYEDLERVGRYNSIGHFNRPQMVHDDFSGSVASSSGEFNFNTPPTSSRPSSLVLSSAGSASSSPRSSFVLPSYVAPDHYESRTKARNLYNSLLSLLQSSHSAYRHSTRWQAIAPSMALQIFRFTNAPPDMLPAFEEKLAAAISQIDAPHYQDVEQSLHGLLMAEMANRVKEFKPLSGVALFTAATGKRIPAQGNVTRDPDIPMRDVHDDSGVDDIANRLAHIGVLNWRVWSPLIYLVDIDEMYEDAPSTHI